MNQVDRYDLGPQVNLDIEGVLIPQVVVNFGSQVNILPKITWLKLGHSQLTKSDFYLKLAVQGLAKPLGIWKDVETTMMGMSTRIDFEVIEPKPESNSYSTLVGQPYGGKMKANISLNKDRKKIKGKGKKVIISLDLREGRPWDEPDDDDGDVRWWY